MNIPALSIKRPVFIFSIVLFVVLIGFISLKRLGVDLFPEINFPYVSVSTPYIGASPEEIQNLITRLIEEEVSGISGIEQLTSINQEGLSMVLVKFSLDVDIKDAEQQIRNKISKIRRDLPEGIDEPLIQRFDPADVPIMRISLSAELPPAKIYDLAKEIIKPKFEQVKNIGAVKILGGTRREIQVELDRNKLNQYQISAVSIASQLKNYGMNVPVGKYDRGLSEINFKTLGRFEALSQVRNSVVSFSGDISGGVSLKELGTVRDGVEDAQTLAFLYHRDTNNKGKNEKKLKHEELFKPAVYFDIYKQSGANTVAVTDEVLAKLAQINQDIKEDAGKPNLVIVRNAARWIRVNIDEAFRHILIAISLTILVVYFFLGNVRSTFITGIALPNSLLGSFILMLAMGFTVNIITLLALTLAIGLLVDDAIVVRENIFRKIESGMHPVKASEVGTNEVLMAVIASTITIIAVFLPVGFMSGIVGQFFKQFGLTMVFTMAISLFDGLFVAPMLSAYFSGKINHKPNIIIRNFRKFQDWLDNTYVRTIRFGLNNPKKVLLVVTLVFFGSLFSMKFVKGTFMPPQDMGEFQISIEVPQGSSLTATHETVKKIENKLKEIKDIEVISSVAGSDSGEANLGNIGIRMFPPGVRSMTTQQLKEHIREVFKDWKDIKLSVNDYGIVGGAGSGRFQKNFILNLSGADQEHLDAYAEKVMADMAKVPGLTEIETSSEKGKPEFHIDLDPQKMQMLGVLPTIAGTELRLHVAGAVVGKFYENGIEYDIRMRLKPEQRNLKSAFYETKVPNTNFRYIRLSDVSRGLVKEGPARIYREDRAQVVQIVANLKEGYGIAEVMTAARKILTVTNPMPKGIKYKFIGQAEEFGNMVRNFLLAFGIAIAIIYLILASLYESYITPITIFIAIPPALSGGFLALALTRSLMDMNAMIGMIMLLGIVTKNSILLVDFGLERVKRGYTYQDAILEAGRLRLRPILMTTFAMIAGTSPIAFGIGEASKQRTSMGIVIIGGLIVSTFLTLIVVPVIFELVDQFREKIERRFRPDFDMKLVGKGSEGKHS